MITENIHYVNNTGMNLDLFRPTFVEAYNTGILDEDYQDIFSIEILKGYNLDGSDRIIIEMK